MSGISTRLAIAFAVAAGCTSTGHSPGGDSGGLQVIGQLVDFQSGQDPGGHIAASTDGVVPAPTVTLSAPMFILDNVPAHSVFYVLASSDGHRPTYSSAIDVEDTDVDNVEVRVVSEQYLSSLASAFGVTPTAANGVLFARVVDANGTPRAGVPASAFAPIAGARGPYFLGPDLSPVASITQTSSSGWVVWFEVAPGLAQVANATGAAYSVDMALSPIAPATATVAVAKVTDGPIVMPKNVSFATQVVPIFTARGCAACHSGNGPGKDLANLTLDGSDNLIHRELMDPSTTSTEPRVDLAHPEKSLVLTMPSFENPPDAHPTVVFQNAMDKDYLTILVWIREGAKQN